MFVIPNMDYLFENSDRIAGSATDPTDMEMLLVLTPIFLAEG